MKIYHWLLPALSLFPASAAAQMAGYEYWTDGNDTQRTYVEQTQGSVGIEIDVADLRPGIHQGSTRRKINLETICYRLQNAH